MDSLLSQNANLNGMFQNSGYNFNRTERKILIIDYIISTTITEIVLPLYEPLLIDKLSDVYLESFTTQDAFINTSSSNGDKMTFVVSIDEFNINSNSNQYSTGTTITNVFNKIIIPNESGASNVVTVHKSKKLNYICSINPTRLNNLTIKITDLGGATMFSSNGRFILELVFIARK